MASSAADRTRISESEHPALRLGSLDRLPLDDLRRAAMSRPLIEVPLPSVGFAQDPNDITHDYARALYAAETLAPLGALSPAAEGRTFCTYPEGLPSGRRAASRRPGRAPSAWCGRAGGGGCRTPHRKDLKAPRAQPSQ